LIDTYCSSTDKVAGLPTEKKLADEMLRSAAGLLVNVQSKDFAHAAPALLRCAKVTTDAATQLLAVRGLKNILAHGMN